MPNISEIKTISSTSIDNGIMYENNSTNMIDSLLCNLENPVIA